MKRNLCLSIGLLLLIFAAYLQYERITPRRLTFAYKTTPNNSSRIESPIGVVIPSLGISLPIFPATVSNNSWPTTDKGVSYLLSSPLPGEKGNSVLYAHNWSNLFGKLPEIKVGDTIKVIGKKNSVTSFSVKYTAEVDPSNASILAPSTDKRITLYTCTGFLDSKRFVVVATL
jgi:sortase A